MTVTRLLNFTFNLNTECTTNPRIFILKLTCFENALGVTFGGGLQALYNTMELGWLGGFAQHHQTNKEIQKGNFLLDLLSFLPHLQIVFENVFVFTPLSVDFFLESFSAPPRAKRFATPDFALRSLQKGVR